MVLTFLLLNSKAAASIPALLQHSCPSGHGSSDGFNRPDPGTGPVWPRGDVVLPRAQVAVAASPQQSVAANAESVNSFDSPKPFAWV